MPFFERHVMFDMLMEHDSQGVRTSFWSPVLCVHQELHLIGIIIGEFFILSSQSLEQKARRMKLIIQREEKTLLLLIKYRTMSICNALFLSL